jgi:hypothetical protein
VNEEQLIQLITYIKSLAKPTGAVGGDSKGVGRHE